MFGIAPLASLQVTPIESACKYAESHDNNDDHDGLCQHRTNSIWFIDAIKRNSLPPGFDLDQTECRKFNTQPRRSAASRLLAIVCHRGTGRCQRQSIALATDWGSSTSQPLKKYLMLREQYERRSKLTPGYSITVENLDNAHRQSESAAASYQQAIASRDTATLKPQPNRPKCGHQSMVSSPISILQTAPMPRRASR